MSDLIDREQALKAVSFDSEAYYAINNLPSAEEDLPSAEKTGMWIPIISHTKDGQEKIQWGCSECGQSMYQFGQRFCSGCGARMVEDEH